MLRLQMVYRLPVTLLCGAVKQNPLSVEPTAAVQHGLASRHLSHTSSGQITSPHSIPSSYLKHDHGSSVSSDTGVTWRLASTMARQELCLSFGQGLEDKRPCDVCMLLERHAQSFSCWRPYE